MNLIQRMLTVLPAAPNPVTLDFFKAIDGRTFPYSSMGGNLSTIGTSFRELVQDGYQSNGVVFACELARQMLFMQARYQFRQLRSGRPGDYFGTPELAILEKPWANATTGDLNTQMLQYADFGGDTFVVRRKDKLKVLRPDWTILVSGSDDPYVPMSAADVDADELGIIYWPGGRASGSTPSVFRVGEYAHFCPIPDPLSIGRGMPWLAPIVREIEADNAMTVHKGKYFDQGATVNLVVTGVPSETEDKFNEWVARFKKGHEGVQNAYRTLYLGGAAKAEKLGSDMAEASFRETQGAGEVRICIAAGVPPTVVGVSEGLQGSSLNAGNFAAAMRRFADLTMRPLWQNAAGSLEAIIPTRSGSQLWYDDRDIPALKDDIKDAAEVQSKQGQTIRQLTDAGFEPDAVIEAVTAGDLARLKGNHSGLFSVQLQPPGTTKPEPAPDPNAPPDMVPAPDMKPAVPVGGPQ